ncbi:UNVERIFIED_CONTAM: hypothetical protein PYX00_009491 [Menopon gallinae]
MNGGDGLAINTGHHDVDLKVKEWLMWDKNPKTTEEVAQLLREGNIEKLKKLFLGRIEFGTAGLRGRMGAGYTQMNDLVVIQTAQGLAKYLTKTFKDVAVKSIVIGYDGRYNSRRFAELTASVFLNENFKVYLFSDLCPTPFVPFSVTHYDCLAGVMVTASHNPKEDNGYKVYWRNGAQIISPHDKEIHALILNNLQPLPSSWNTKIIFGNPNVVDPLAEVMVSYYARLKKLVLFSDINRSSDLRIVYTAMHGVGYKYVVEAFKTGSLNEFYVVKEQRDPDPEFPTVRFPNPEEGKSALNLSIQTAEENDCTLILANDPDADRLAVAEKVSNRVKEWKIFTGNEIGALLGWWSFFCYKYENPNVKNYENVYMLSSTVSSKILSTMSKKEGFKFEETLTGFKWMGNVSFDRMKTGKTVLFAFEEAIGFMCGTGVLDKDGVSAAVKVAEMAAYLKQNHNLNLQDKLRELYMLYGQHITLNSYYICHDPSTINRIFHRLRNFAEETNKSYPKSILRGKYVICGVRDLTTGYDDSYPDLKARLPTSKSSQMITFRFTNGLVATLRTSGTEPKIKYYTELCSDSSEQNSEKLRGILNEMVNALVEEFLEPTKNGLLPRSD